MNSPWIEHALKNPEVSAKNLFTVSDQLASFRRMGTLQKGILSFLTNLLATEEELEELATIFKAFDTSNDGFISMEELKEGIEKNTGTFKYLETDFEEMLKNLDSNNDGQVDF